MIIVFGCLPYCVAETLHFPLFISTLRYMILSLWFGLFFSVAAAKSHYENNLRDEEWRRPKFYTCVLRIEHPSLVSRQNERHSTELDSK